VLGHAGHGDRASGLFEQVGDEGAFPYDPGQPGLRSGVGRQTGDMAKRQLRRTAARRR
jgi:hypothetical protein